MAAPVTKEVSVAEGSSKLEVPLRATSRSNQPAGSVQEQEITRALHGTTLEAFWASLCFLLAVVAVMPIVTSLSDVLGRQIPLYASFIIFIAGSIIFAVANSMGVPILGRIL
ncbi:hypothetical protein QQS21_005181 [Conoideocrella luteorostrata]|uniref:Major facilitator superfamily (MFS) profile domain-containing protein n=1 Tax=Conoideocrella luteorostrata TaxID=1105319 RepID=A0AAJ0CSF2_9HYPO|nr:hypothetical protein QQS21_005181 [Conoideocrella luteorostrata]